MLCVPYFIRGSSIHSKGIFAAKKINKGGDIYEIKKNELRKITIEELKKWSESKKNLFLKFSFQGGKNFYYVGVSNYEKEEPVDDSFYMNHSCNPNCWHSGNKIVARRDINKDEELTIDYGTIMSPNGLEEDFICKCLSPNCRGLISKNDCLNPAIIEQYRGHFAPFIPKSFVA